LPDNKISEYGQEKGWCLPAYDYVFLSLLAFIRASFTKNVLYLLDSVGCVSLRMVDDMAAPVGTYLICILYKSLISSPLCISGNKVLLSQYYGACRRSDVYFCVFSFLCCIYPRNCFRTSLHILLFKCKLWSLSTVKLWVWLRSNLWENSIFITF